MKLENVSFLGLPCCAKHGNIVVVISYCIQRYPIDGYWINVGVETSVGCFILTDFVLADTYDVWLVKLTQYALFNHEL